MTRQSGVLPAMVEAKKFLRFGLPQFSQMGEAKSQKLFSAYQHDGNFRPFLDLLQPIVKSARAGVSIGCAVFLCFLASGLSW